jgi:hypothetical protein
MRNGFTGLMVVAIAAFVLSVSPRSVAQGGGQGAPAAGGGQARPSPTANLPFDPKDFNGVWGGQTMSGPNRQFTREEPPMTPKGLAFYKAQKTEFSNPPVDGPGNTDPILRCEPGSTPRTYALTHPIKVVQSPRETVILLETYRNFRIIYTDGRKMADHPEGTWYGDSVGHWEGNTLVVETANYNGRSWLDQVGHPMSDKMKITEKLSRPDHDHLVMDFTFDDPVNYTRTWGGQMRWTLRPAGWEIEDYLCSPADEAFMNTLVRDPADMDPSKLKK